MPNGNIQITWEKVNDPTSLFNSYKVYQVTSSSSTLIHTEANINQTSYIHSGVNGNLSSFSFVVGTTCSSSITNISDTVSSMKLTVNNPGNGLAILNWNKIFKPTNAASASNWYKIYQEYPLGTWTLIDSVQYGSEFYRDSITICNDTVNYRITNFNSTCISVSSVDGDNFQDVIAPNSPVIKNVSVNPISDQSEITWCRGYPEDVSGYIILKFISGSWVPIDTVWGINNTSYLFSSSNASSESECFGIAAFDSCWYGIPLSPNTSAMGTPHCSILLENTYDVCNKTIDLSWNAYTNWNLGVNKYLIYYTINNGAPILQGSTNNLTHQITNVKPDSSYCFTIIAVSNNSRDTAISNKSCLETKYPFISDTNYLQTVTVIDESSIELRILTPPYNTINGYEIFRSLDGAPFSNIGFVSNSASPIKFIDSDNNLNTSENSYKYKAIAVDSCNLVTDKETNSSQSILLNTVSNSANFVNTLTWNPYLNWDGSVLRYNIYRKLGNNPAIIIGSVPGSNNYFEDDISSFYASSDDGNFCYYIEAIENINQYGFSETSLSNTSCASPEHLIYIPNAFSPNNDGLNDEFKPIIGFANYNTYSLKIFNRLGHLIFTSTDVFEGWDGTENNGNSENTIFIYLVLIEDSKGQQIQKSGTVMLVK